MHAVTKKKKSERPAAIFNPVSRHFMLLVTKINLIYWFVFTNTILNCIMSEFLSRQWGNEMAQVACYVCVYLCCLQSTSTLYCELNSHFIFWQICAEFHRITNLNLKNHFYAELDRHAPRLQSLFRKKAASKGKVAEVLIQLFVSYDLQVSRLCLLVFYSHTRVDYLCQNGHLFSHGRALSCDINCCVAILFTGCVRVLEILENAWNCTRCFQGLKSAWILGMVLEFGIQCLKL